MFALVEQGVDVPEEFRAITHFFDYAALRSMARSVIGDSIVPGGGHLRAIDFRRRFPQFRHYWFIEYDVVYTGDWRRFLKDFAGDESDLIATRLRKFTSDLRWFWGSSFSTGDSSVTRKDWLIAFLPIHRISARGIEALERVVAEGWVGHYEILVPSALAYSGLGLSDIGGNGPFTPKDRIDRHYYDCRKLRAAGTFRVYPPIRWRPIRNALYHPCKTPESQPGQRRNAVRPFRQKPAACVFCRLMILRLAILSRLRPSPGTEAPGASPPPVDSVVASGSGRIR
ncbi:DUF3405 domain-containing protein [Bauldia litoralis]|uniref:DUF3405 domain-containing protein n=1 Tax=Bauldia litoralis TaxID=665467 RepID=UPI00111416D4|nr:DUF3405 domain-containing protein [Bauldia litoralis]